MAHGVVMFCEAEC